MVLPEAAVHEFVVLFVTEIGISLTSLSTEFIIVSLELKMDYPRYVPLHPFTSLLQSEIIGERKE